MASTSTAQRELSQHRVPCGPVSVGASAVCRRRLRDNFAMLLDRLCEECHPEPVFPQAPDGHTMMPDGTIMEDAHLKAEEMKKKQKQAKKDDPIGKLAEALKGAVGGGTPGFADVGNSKMVQDSTGKIEPYGEGKTKQSTKPKQ